MQVLKFSKLTKKTAERLHRCGSNVFNVNFGLILRITLVSHLLNLNALLPSSSTQRHPTSRRYLFKVNNRNTRTMREIGSKLTIKTTERCHWRRSVVFIANFEQVSHCSSVSIVDFEQVNTGWAANIFFFLFNKRSTRKSC